MKVIRDIQAMADWSREQRRAGRTIGFVPTMGYLHDAHLSLVDIARERADVTAASIFVNPAQFDRAEDLESYPRDEERDLALLEARGVDAVWLPTRNDVYPPGYATWVTVEGLDKHLCGASRPGHFKGVTTIVSVLFKVVKPDLAVFGRKDAQQARIIQQMTEDLRFGIEIVLGDTLREDDGLAMSSRNVRLSPDHREQAPALYQGLQTALAAFQQGERSAEALTQLAADHILTHAPAGTIDYVQLVDWSTLELTKRITAPALLAVAVYFDSVRLIDNIVLEPAL